jgi:short-subunit dehydrogenase
MGQPRRRLEECRVLLTGASSGIGRELALALARRRARLLLGARRAERLQALAEEIRAGGGEALYVPGDVAEPAVRAAAFEQAQRHWHGLDVLVNNAGVSAHGRFAASDEATLRRIMEVNFFAAVELVRAALPILSQGRDPAVVNIGSILGHRGVPHNAEYVASKFALRGWSEAVRPELAAVGVELLLVSPGTTDTEFFEHLVAKRGELPWRAQRGIAAAAVARQTIRALERRRRETFPNWRGRALVWANRLAPGVVDRWLMRYGK